MKQDSLAYKLVTGASRTFVATISRVLKVPREDFRGGVDRLITAVGVIRKANQRAIQKIDTSGLSALLETSQEESMSVLLPGDKMVSLKRKHLQGLKDYLDKQNEYLEEFDIISKAEEINLDLDKLLNDMMG